MTIDFDKEVISNVSKTKRSENSSRTSWTCRYMSSRVGDLHPIHGYDFKDTVFFSFHKPCRAERRSITEHLMEGVALQSFHKCFQFPKLPLWIIEYVWAHKMTDIQQGWFSQYIFWYDVNLLPQLLFRFVYWRYRLDDYISYI